MSSSEAIKMVVTEPRALGGRSDPGAAFRRLADGHLDAAYRLATAILHDPNEAQDATHDAFVRAWTKWSALRDEAKFEQWFDRILVNACRDRLRRAKRWHPTDISGSLAEAAGDPFSAAHDRDQIRSAIESLGPDHRIVIALRFYLDLTPDQIAGRLDVPVGTIHSRLHYALKRLQAVIE